MDNYLLFKISRIHVNFKLLFDLFFLAEVYKNHQLRDYAFINAHFLRGPLTTIMSLIELLKVVDAKEEQEICIKYLEDTANKLDGVIYTIQTKIS